MTTGERIKALRPENSNYESIILIGEKMAEAAIEARPLAFAGMCKRKGHFVDVNKMVPN